MAGSATGILVALKLRRGEDFVARLLRAWDEGHAVLPLNPDLPDSAAKSLLDALRPARLLTDSGEIEWSGVPVSEETALVVPTSGTTGNPKGAELSHASLDWAARTSLERLGDAASGRWLCCLPLHHIAGLMTVLRGRLKGELPIIHDRFDPDAIAGQTDASVLSLVPAALQKLMDAGVDLSRFSAILLGGGPLPPDLLRKAADKNLKIVTTYGMTETCGGCVYDGLPLRGVGLKLAGEQILLKGPMLFSRYRLEPGITESVLKDGWFHTADRGSLSDEGLLSVLGRLDDVIITGGENVSPEEVEKILSEHPSVQEAAVVGIPSQRWGQEIAAAVVLRTGEDLDLEDLKTFFSSRGPEWMTPKKIRQVASLPKSPTGKVVRRDLLRLFQGGG